MLRKKDNNMNGSDIVVESLVENGVTHIFGVPGDTSMNFHDALSRNGKIQYIVCRDERNAAYMADGYARVLNRHGVVDVPSGGGVLYCIPGLAESNDSSIPLVCISSDITMSSEETEALTDVRQLELTAPVTKWNCKIKSTKKIQQYIQKAFRIALLGKPGATHVSIPENIHGEEIVWAYKKTARPPSLFSLKSGPGNYDCLAVKEAILKAKYPIIIAGGGVHSSGAYDPLLEFSEKLGAFVATSINGKGSISEVHPLSIGVIGANGGSEETNKIVSSADLVIILGSKMNNVTSMGGAIFNEEQTIIQVDISEKILGTNVYTHLPILGDIVQFLRNMNNILRDEQQNISSRHQWKSMVGEILQRKKNRIKIEEKNNTKFVNPAKFFKTLMSLVDENTIFVADAGTPTPYIASYCRMRLSGRHTVMPRAHGSLGYALPAAIGVKVAKPDTTVVSMFGDGSFGMALGDLETAKRVGLPIIFVNFQNNSYGWIKTIQKLYYDERYYAVDFDKIDATRISEGFGLKAKKISSNDEIESVLHWSLQQKSPVLLDVYIETPTELIPPVVKWERDKTVPVEKRKKLTY